MKEREPFLIANFAIKGKESTGATAKVAKKIANALSDKGIKFDTFEIVPVETYPADRANFEMAVKAEKESHTRPKIVGKYSRMKDVKDIFLIVPNWCNSLPQGVFTFLDEYDFAEKRIVPVVVSAGDGGKEIVTELRNFLGKVWIMDAVEINDSELDTPETLQKVTTAVNEILRPSTSKF